MADLVNYGNPERDIEQVSSLPFPLLAAFFCPMFIKMQANQRFNKEQKIKANCSLGLLGSIHRHLVFSWIPNIYWTRKYSFFYTCNFPAFSAQSS
jgi:hypothetical protein